MNDLLKALNIVGCEGWNFACLAKSDVIVDSGGPPAAVTGWKTGDTSILVDGKLLRASYGLEKDFPVSSWP